MLRVLRLINDSSAQGSNPVRNICTIYTLGHRTDKASRGPLVTPVRAARVELIPHSPNQPRSSATAEAGAAEKYSSTRSRLSVLRTTTRPTPIDTVQFSKICVAISSPFLVIFMLGRTLTQERDEMKGVFIFSELGETPERFW
jgi:hypothetical protein